MEEPVYIAENIVFIRSLADMTQSEFGKLLGITRHSLHTYEVARTIPKPLIQKKIAAFAGVTVQKLMYTMLDAPDVTINPDAVLQFATNDTDATNVNEPEETYRVLSADERKALWDIINAQKDLIDRLSKEAKGVKDK